MLRKNLDGEYCEADEDVNVDKDESGEYDSSEEGETEDQCGDGGEERKKTRMMWMVRMIGMRMGMKMDDGEGY